MSKRRFAALCCITLASLCGTAGVSLSSDWVRLLPRDPWAWVDLNSARIDSAGFIHVQLSLTGNPSGRRHADNPIRLVKKAVDCKSEDAVYDVDANGNTIQNRTPAASSYEKILEPAKDRDLEKALLKRVCQNK